MENLHTEDAIYKQDQALLMNLVILLTALWPVLRAKSTLPPLLRVLMKVLASALRKGRREEACKTGAVQEKALEWSALE